MRDVVTASPTLLRTRRAGPGMRAPTCSNGILPHRPVIGRGDVASSEAGANPPCAAPDGGAHAVGRRADRAGHHRLPGDDPGAARRGTPVDPALRQLADARDRRRGLAERRRRQGGRRFDDLEELSRDQAIRALIAHSDERFQALASRTGRLEDTMNMLAESVRSAREQIPAARTRWRSRCRFAARRRPDPRPDRRGQPPGGRAFKTLADRDQEIVETLQAQIRKHGELITQETARISQAMQEYVSQGVEAMGRLAGSADSSLQAMSAHDDESADPPGDRWISRSPSSPNTCSSCTTGPGSR